MLYKSQHGEFLAFTMNMNIFLG